MGGALAFWLLLMSAIALLAPRSAVATARRERASRAFGTGAELHEYLADRLTALRFLSTTPSVAGHTPLLPQALQRFREAYPEFSNVYLSSRRPAGGVNRPIYLAVRLREGGYIVGLLKPDWTSRRFRGAYHFRQGTGGTRTVLVSRAGARSETSAIPPGWDVLQGIASGQSSIVTWGDGLRYVTSVSRLGDLPNPHPTLIVVCAIPERTVLASAAHVQRALLSFGLVAGLLTGTAGCVVLGWATRWLRKTNRELEARVAKRTGELELAERSFRGIFENAPLGLYQCDPEGRLLRVNPSMAQTLGYPDPAAAIVALGSIQAVGDHTMRADFFDRLRSETGVSETTTVVTKADGSTIWLAEQARLIRDEAGKTTLIEGAMHDVTAQRELESQLRRLGETDPLTGLINRRGLDEAITAAELPVSFVALDVDRFKEYNDKYGHPAGDHALRTVAEALRLTVRGADAVARAGGEEFVVVLPRTGAQGAQRVAEALRRAVQECGGLEIRLTVSGGVATAATAEEVDEAFAAADRALYMAKEAGRNRIVVNSAKLA